VLGHPTGDLSGKSRRNPHSAGPWGGWGGAEGDEALEPRQCNPTAKDAKHAKNPPVFPGPEEWMREVWPEIF
jgi:hypothetical protein